MLGQNDLGIPESNTASVNIWVAEDGANPIGNWNDKGDDNAWDWGFHFTQHANLAIYGKGLEVDGGTPGQSPSGGYYPYGRFVHGIGPWGSSDVITGTIRNAWPDYGGRDSAPNYSYFTGLYNNSFAFCKDTKTSGTIVTWTRLFQIGSTGEIETPVRIGDGVGVRGTQYFKFPRLTTSQRNSLTDAIGMCIFNDDTNTLQLRKSGGWVTITHG
jgi:hypothetical protein